MKKFNVLNLAEIKGMFPLQGRGGDLKLSEQYISPSLEFVSSHSFANKFFSLPRRDRRATCILSEVGGVPSPRGRARVGANKKAAFTLAEVLITLGIIGVVAAITLPTMITNLNERINSERQANIAQKVTQAMEQMRAHGLLNQSYASTDAFVDELQKYLKVAKRCSASNIADCWPTAKVTTADGEEFEVSKAKKGSNLNHKENESDNVGLVLADRASLIMTYNTSAGGLDVGDRVTAIKKELPVGGGKFKEFPYSTSVAGAVDFVMDVNGAKGPNSETVDGKYHDIRSFNGAQFAKGMVCDFEVENLCVKNLGTTYSSVTSEKYGPGDYWEGAKKACSDIGMSLTSQADLNTIYAHKGESGVPTWNDFWSSAEDENDKSRAWGKAFNLDIDESLNKGYQSGAMCVGN